MIALADENGLRLVAGATHPFADWRVQDIYPDERYLQVVEDMQMVARANLIFGLHVHVGIEDRETLDPPDEPDALLPAAPAGALDQLAVLDRHEHRPEVVPLQGVRPVPAHEHPRHVRVSGPISTDFVNLLVAHQLHRQRQEDLVGHPAASVLRHARDPRSATSRCAWTRRWRSPRSSRRRWSSCTGCTRATRAGACTAAR